MSRRGQHSSGASALGSSSDCAFRQKGLKAMFVWRESRMILNFDPHKAYGSLGSPATRRVLILTRKLMGPRRRWQAD